MAVANFHDPVLIKVDGVLGPELPKLCLDVVSGCVVHDVVGVVLLTRTRILRLLEPGVFLNLFLLVIKCHLFLSLDRSDASLFDHIAVRDCDVFRLLRLGASFVNGAVNRFKIDFWCSTLCGGFPGSNGAGGKGIF